MNHQFTNLAAASVLALISPAFATIPFDDAQWSGPEKIFEIVPGAPSAKNIQTFVENISEGVLSLDDVANKAMKPRDRVSKTLRPKFTFKLTGGTGDISLGNTSSSDGGKGKDFFNSVNLSGLEGVTRVEVTLAYNEPLGSRAQALHILNSLPTLGAVGVSSAGKDLNEKNFRTVARYGGGVHSKDGVVFTPGAPRDAPAVITKGFNGPTSAGPTFRSNGFTGLVAPGGGPISDHFLLLRGYDLDDKEGFNAGDASLFYAKQIKWTLTPGSGTFAEDTAFVFSMDGQQHENFDRIPEPSSAFLLTLAAGGMLARRRRA